MWPASHRAGPVDDAGHIQAFQHGHHQRQRAHQVAARGGIKPSEGRGQIVQRPGVLQPVTATQICHNTMADLARLVPKALHDVHVFIDPAAQPHLLDAHEHFPNSIGALIANDWWIAPRSSNTQLSFPNNYTLRPARQSHSPPI